MDDPEQQRARDCVARGVNLAVVGAGTFFGIPAAAPLLTGGVRRRNGEDYGTARRL